MTVPGFVERAYLRAVDAVTARRRQPCPSDALLRRCRLVSHRGEYDNRSIMENSLAAFDKAAAAGVWGLECDVRWTRDAIPVVTHDVDLTRLHGDRRRVDKLTFTELRARFPGIPTLAELVERFGGRLHLMVEFKHDSAPRPSTRCSDTVASIFSGLRPGEDFHFMTLNPHASLLNAFPPEKAWVPIAGSWAVTLCREAMTREWDGVCAHYSMLRASMIIRLRRCGKKVGTGYADSTNCLFRELNRGVDWIFSNRAAAMQAAVRRALFRKPA